MMDEFVQGFISEAGELLLKLEDDLIRLEFNPQNAEIVNDIFRIMHTLKGSAGMVGLKNIQNLTHEFENIYSRIRNGEMKINSHLIDITLKARDSINSMLYNSEEKGSEDLMHSLLDSMNTEEVDRKTDSSMLYIVLFCPDKNVFERGLNPAKSLNELKTKGEMICIPHEDTGIKAQQDRKLCNTQWEIYLKSDANREDIQDVFLFYESDEYFIQSARDPEFVLPDEIMTRFEPLYGNKKEAGEQVKKHLLELIHKNPEIPPGPPEKSTETRQAESSKTESENTVNVSSHKLDELMNLVSELVTQTATIQVRAAGYHDVKLNGALENIEKLTKKFRNNALDLRLIPVGTLLNKFKRQVRDLSRELNKKVQLIIEGQDIEIDKTILKSIESPLQHIIRNSIDHGLEFSEERLSKGKTEEGLLKITAFYSGASVIIQVQDDGRGINLERVRECAIKKGLISQDQAVTREDLIGIIMEPGFTTSENVSIVSGRGVGMDVVRKELNNVGGSLEVFTEKDLGTSITMKLPTTLTIIDTLMVNIAETRVLIPVMDIEYCFKENHQVLFNRDNRYLEYKGNPIPLVFLRTQFGFASTEADDQMVVVINKFERRFAIVIDEIVGEHQAVIKPLGELFVNQPFFSGGSILVDGDLAFILDTNFLFNHITKLKN